VSDRWWAAVGGEGGRVVAKVRKSGGVDTLFPLSGGHLFSIYDGCKAEGIRILDVRHEQTAAFAAEGFAKATRGVGVAALTAGPRGPKSARAAARAPADSSPGCPLGGPGAALRWGGGAPQGGGPLPLLPPPRPIAPPP